MLDKSIETVAALLATARRVVVLTGAGVSKESGIPTFRDAQVGLWADYDPQKLATPEGFLADPPLVWRWYDWRRGLLLKASPNPGHFAIAELEELVPAVVVVTQNIDGLHARAGSTDIIELHGSIAKFFCFQSHHPAENVPMGLDEPPKCFCGSLIRPGVVWFGEALPVEAIERATAEMRRADVAIVVGTSALVYPAALLPYAAKHAGAKVVEVNPEPTAVTDVSDAFLQGPSGELLPRVIEVLKQEKKYIEKSQ